MAELSLESLSEAWTFEIKKQNATRHFFFLKGRLTNLEDDVSGSLIFVDGDLVFVTVKDRGVVVDIQEVDGDAGGGQELVQSDFPGGNLRM